MKKLFIVFLMLGGAIFQQALASENIRMGFVNNGSVGNIGTFAPPRPWYITQDDYVLTIPALADGYTLELRDEDDVVVYSTYLPAGTTLVTLPSTLSGDFELRLVADTYYYRGYLSL